MERKRMANIYRKLLTQVNERERNQRTSQPTENESEPLECTGCSDPIEGEIRAAAFPNDVVICEACLEAALDAINIRRENEHRI